MENHAQWARLLLVGVVGVVVSILLWLWLSQSQNEQIHREIGLQAETVSSVVQAELEAQMLALGRMGKRWEMEGGTARPLWEADAGAYYLNFPGHQALAWADASGHLKWVVPTLGNELLEQYELTSMARLQEPLLQARNMRETRISPIVTLPQGSAGFYALVPLFAGNTFDGYIVGVFELEAVFQAILPIEPLLSISLEVTEGGREIYTQAERSPRNREDWNVETSIRFYDQEWALEIWPTTVYLAEQHSALPQVFLVIGLVITGLVIIILRQAGQVTGSQAIQEANEQLAKEINDRKLLSEALRTSEERFALATEGAGAGIWDWMNVKQDEEWWSPQFFRLLGYRPHEIAPSLENFAALLHPDDKERTFALVEQHFNGQANFDIEYRLKTKSGVYRWFLGSGITRFDVDGNPLRMVGSIFDINDRKMREIELDTLYEISPDAICIISPEGYFKRVSASFADQLGYDRETLLSKHASDFVHPEDKARTATYRRKVAESEVEMIAYEVRYVCANGKVIWMSWSAKMDASIGYIYAVGRNVTRDKEFEKELLDVNKALARSNQELEAFASVAAHDLRSPLRAIENLTNWIIEDDGDSLPESVQSRLSQVNQRALRLSRLLDDLLTYARTGQEATIPEVIDLAEFVQEVLEMLDLPDSYAVELALHPATVMAPRAPLQQILHNLIGNAIKHHDRSDGLVKIHCEADDEQYRLTVEDDGPGIDPEYHERIFKLFHTLKPRDTVEGSGMGLAIVKKILTNLGGTITVASKPGEGAAFTITWPLHHTADVLEESPMQSPTTSIISHKTPHPHD